MSRLAEKRHYASLGGPQLTAQDQAQWWSVQGELHDADPNWRFERQLVEEMAAMTEGAKNGRLFAHRQDLYFGYLKVLSKIRIAPTEKEAQAEVFELRRAFLVGDLKAAEKLAKRGESRRP